MVWKKANGCIATILTIDCSKENISDKFIICELKSIDSVRISQYQKWSFSKFNFLLF